MSNKQRSLSYIREKNRIRKLGFTRGFFKISKELVSDVELLKEFSSHHIRYMIDTFGKKYKMNFKLHDVEMGLDGDDFLKDLKTIKVKLIIDHN
jgi:hypothetical protein